MTLEVLGPRRCAQNAGMKLKAKQLIAIELADHEIAAMRRDEMIALLRDMLPLCLENRVKRRLEFFDRPTLERIFYLGRRCLQNQLQFVPG
jgi:hypothetical protein